MQSRCVKTKPWERRHLASVAFLLAGKMPALPGFGVLWFMEPLCSVSSLISRLRVRRSLVRITLQDRNKRI